MIIRPDALCQIEIGVRDLDRAIIFYREVFGWKPVPAHIHDYIVLDVPEDCRFGISLVVSAEPRISGNKTGVVLYFKVENPDAILQIALDNGGIKHPIRRLPGYGRIFQFSDPDGQMFGLYSPESRP
jgi:predicted enzyme related to lactoylglutathione lyase